VYIHIKELVHCTAKVMTSLRQNIENLMYAGPMPEAPEGMWGIPPFFIERGPHQVAHQGATFEFGAPTTSKNALRVLRALQLKRSVLLEGSPGVGKTALVAALARATGQPPLSSVCLLSATVAIRKGEQY